MLLQSCAPSHLFRGCSFLYHIQATLQSDEVPPRIAILSRQLHQGFGALAGAEHQFFS
jgi:hypothetical protein